jgi:hypothetical protein
MRYLVSFAHPLAFSLLALVALLFLPRRRPQHYLAFNVPTTANLPQAPWYRSLPATLLTAFMMLLIGLVAEPMGGTEELYTVQEARKILLLIDTSSSMEGRPIRAAKSVAEAFIRQRPASDSIGVVLFSDVASGGIMTHNHHGLIKELRMQEGISISGTQLGVGLFKCLASFIEDEVETALWKDRTLPETLRQQRFQHALDEIGRLGRHLLHRGTGEFVLRLPDIPDQRQLGKSRVLIILSDARVRLENTAEEIIDHLQVLRLYEKLSFERLYFISVDTLPKHLEPFFQRHPFWRFFHVRSVADHQQLAQAYAEIDRLETTPSRLQVRTIPRALYVYGLPGLFLVPLALILRLLLPFRSLL